MKKIILLIALSSVMTAQAGYFDSFKTSFYNAIQKITGYFNDKASGAKKRMATIYYAWFKKTNPTTQQQVHEETKQSEVAKPIELPATHLLPVTETASTKAEEVLPQEVQQGPEVSVERSKFFEEIMGIKESDFKSFLTNATQEDAKQYIIPAGTDKILRLKGADGKIFRAGYFEEISIKTLRTQVAGITPSGAKGKLNIIAVYDDQMENHGHEVDVGALQALPQYKGAVFQVASNFSGLEPKIYTQKPELGIETYIGDKTQGPFAAISAAPGLIQRMYYAFYDVNTKPSEWRQTTERQIQLLKDTDIPVTNGYIKINDTYFDKLTSKLEDAFKDYLKETLEKIKVGFQGEVQVTFGAVTEERKDEEIIEKHVRLNRADQIINQVYTAAIDFNITNTKYSGKTKINELAKTIVKGAYEGTILSAIAKGKKQVVLTLIGTGSFGNPLIWITEAINAIMPDIEKHGLEVTVIVYKARKDTQTKKFITAMTDIANATGGSVKIF
ncbi:MAG: hypothetical protein WC707_05035 [Candidatus Babeliaceae bacterium]|jgi:hypothetical protein